MSNYLGNRSRYSIGGIPVPGNTFKRLTDRRFIPSINNPPPPHVTYYMPEALAQITNNHLIAYHRFKRSKKHEYK